MVTAHHNLVGSARVSTVIQDAQLQRDAPVAAGLQRASTAMGPMNRELGPRLKAAVAASAELQESVPAAQPWPHRHKAKHRTHLRRRLVICGHIARAVMASVTPSRASASRPP